MKFLENTFRAVNIGLVNKVALTCDTLGIDVCEVVNAAATRPFGFMPFYRGPGLGWHCIPIDPFYLSWKAKQSGFEARFIELAATSTAQCRPPWYRRLPMPLFGVAPRADIVCRAASEPLRTTRQGTVAAIAGPRVLVTARGRRFHKAASNRNP